VRVSDLPTLNALLNMLSAICILAGYRAIRRKDVYRHRMMMLAALVASALFLTSYLYYHYQVGSVSFPGQGLIRPVYFTILISHIILAAVILPMVIRTVYLALSGQIDRHRRIARWTFPIWMYVSVTGVIVYLMLYGI
jgi:putative membrane protein